MKKIFLLLLCLSNAFVYAHEVRPAYLQLTENTDQSIDILWKQPAMGDFSLPLHPQISAGWMQDSTADISLTETYVIKQWHINNTRENLNNQIIHIVGLEKTITDVLVVIQWANGKTISYILKPSSPSLKISREQTVPVWGYLRLGIEHIWTGIDHLLFVLGLLLLVSNRRKLIATITTFTIAHSITLALATLGIIHVASSFAETCIALSIVFLAVELARHYRGQDGVTYRYPWAISFIFGLMHGLGFAGALASVGLPQQSIPLALLLFNVGVEIGQLVFVMVVLFIMHFVRKIILSRQHSLRWIPVYAIGGMAGFWFVERLVGLLNLP